MTSLQPLNYCVGSCVTTQQCSNFTSRAIAQTKELNIALVILIFILFVMLTYFVWLKISEEKIKK